MTEEINPLSPVCMRAVAWFYKTLGKSVGEAHGDMERVYGNAAPGVATVYRWYECYTGDCPDLRDRARSGRPKDPNLADRVSAALEEEPYSSARHIATLLGASKSSVIDVLKGDLALQYFNLRWVPHQLTAEQRQARVTTSRALIGLLRRSGLAFVLTSDESWFTHYNPHSAKWARTGAEAGQRAKPTMTKEKTMVVVFWSFTGFSFVTAVPRGKTYNTEYVTEMLIPELEDAIRVHRPVVGLRGVKLHWDNARPHTSTTTKSLLAIKGVHVLPHPPYSPDLAPSDFYFFGKVKKMICGIQFRSSDQVVEKVKEIFRELSREELQRTYSNWMERLEWVSENNGEYHT